MMTNANQWLDGGCAGNDGDWGVGGCADRVGGCADGVGIRTVGAAGDSGALCSSGHHFRTRGGVSLGRGDVRGAVPATVAPAPVSAPPPLLMRSVSQWGAPPSSFGFGWGFSAAPSPDPEVRDHARAPGLGLLDDGGDAWA